MKKKRGKLASAEFDKLQNARCAYASSARAKQSGLAPHLAHQLAAETIDWADRNGLQPVQRRPGDPHHHRLRLQGLANQAVARQGSAIYRRSRHRAPRLAAGEPGARLIAATWCASRPCTTRPWTRAAPTPTLQQLLVDGALRAPPRRACRPASWRSIRGAGGAGLGSRDFEQDPFDHGCSRPAPARLHLQALRLRRGLRQGHAAHRPADGSGRGDTTGRQAGLAPHGRAHAAQQRAPVSHCATAWRIPRTPSPPS